MENLPIQTQQITNNETPKQESNQLFMLYQNLSEDDKAKMPEDQREELEDFARSHTRHLRRGYYTVEELKKAAREAYSSIGVQHLNMRADHQNTDNLIAVTVIRTEDLDEDCERPILELDILFATYSDEKAIAYCEKENMPLHPSNEHATDEDERYKANYGFPTYGLTETVDIFGTIESGIGNLAHPIIQHCIEHWQFRISQKKLDPVRAKIAKKHLAKIHKTLIKAGEDEAKQTYPYKSTRKLMSLSFVQDLEGKTPLPLYMLQNLWPILKKVINKKNSFELFKEEFENWKTNDPGLENYTHYVNRTKMKNFGAINNWYRAIIHLAESNQQQLTKSIKSNNPESLVNWFVMKFLGLPTQDKAREYRSKAKKILWRNPKMAAAAKVYLDRGLLNPDYPIIDYTDEVFFYLYDRPWKNALID